MTDGNSKIIDEFRASEGKVGGAGASPRGPCAP
jgi:hypothetical protein